MLNRSLHESSKGDFPPSVSNRPGLFVHRPAVNFQQTLCRPHDVEMFQEAVVLIFPHLHLLAFAQGTQNRSRWTMGAIFAVLREGAHSLRGVRA